MDHADGDLRVRRRREGEGPTVVGQLSHATFNELLNDPLMTQGRRRKWNNYEKKNGNSEKTVFSSPRKWLKPLEGS